MTRLAIIIMAAVFSFASVGCSEKTENKADETTKSMGNDIERATDNAGDKMEGAANKVGQETREAGKDIENAADNAAEEVDQEVEEAGDDIENATDN